jgi:membrane protein
MLKRIRDMLERISKFIHDEIWNPQFHLRSKRHSFLIRQVRIIILAFKGFLEDRVSMRASALTFYTLLSVVPVVAMGFGVAKGFGYQAKMQEFIISNFKGQEEVLNWIISMSMNILDGVQGGLLAGIGMVVLIWSVMQVLTNIENSFNAIWQVRKSRNFFRKFSDYLSIVLIAPILIIVSSSLMVYITTRVETVVEGVVIIKHIAQFVEFLFSLLPYVLIWLLFTLIYMVMPNTKVNFKYALLAGIMAGSAFQFIQWGYIHFQIGVSKYSALYGTFAALPLFLVWLQLSWLIVLLGAEISFAYQNVDNYEFEAESLNLSIHNKRLLALLIMHHIVKNFEFGATPLTSSEFSKELGIPIRLVRELLFDLTQANIVVETVTASPREKGYQPAIDINKISIQFVVEKLEASGSDQIIVKNSKAFGVLSGLYKDIESMLRTSDSNKLLKDIA